MHAKARLLFAVLALLVGCLEAGAAVRVTVDGGAPFVLPDVGREDTTSWYDAETWLRHLPGYLTRGEAGRLSYREASLELVFSAEPPFLTRSGRAVAGVPVPKLVRGRLALPEEFLGEWASRLVGHQVTVKRVHGTGALRVCLDPGHGGPDPGARGTDGQPEKDAVLALAQEIAGQLRRRGFDVMLTRAGDDGLSDSARAAASNHWEADLFLSLHAAGAPRRGTQGFEVFAPVAPAPGVDPRRWEGAQVARQRESARWAQGLRAALREAVPTFDRGLRSLPSPLLEAVNGPACLLEIENLSESGRGEVLSAEGRSAVAAAVASAAAVFFSPSPTAGSDPAQERVR